MTAVTVADLSGGLPIEREYVLDERPEDGVRDAVNVWIEEENGEFAMRVGIEGVAEQWDNHELWLDVAFADGRLLSRRGAGATHPARAADGRASVRGTGPVRFQCLSPYHRWTTSFEGPIAETSATEIRDNPDFEEKAWVDLAFDIDMEMAAPPWEPGSILPEAAEALGGKQGEYMSPRYEQLFRCTGTMRLGGRTTTFRGNGLRIRRTGFRAFAGFWGHCWQSAVFPSGRAFGFNVYPPREDGIASYCEGWIIEEDGTRIGARPVGIPWLRTLETGGEDVSCALETVDGRRIEIGGLTFANTRSRGGHVLPPDWPKDFPIVQQSHATYTWDGERTTGMIERSSKPSVMNI